MYVSNASIVAWESGEIDAVEGVAPRKVGRRQGPPVSHLCKRDWLSSPKCIRNACKIENLVIVRTLIENEVRQSICHSKCTKVLVAIEAGSIN